MTGPIYAQVSEWLGIHASEWSAPHRVVLREQWRVCSRTFGDESPAACGCLLALVREAHGDPNLSAFRQCNGAGTNECTWIPEGAEIRPDGGYVLYAWFVSNHAYGKAVAGSKRTEVEALAAALMAAPRGLETSTVDPDTCALCYGEGGAYGPCRSCKRTKAGEP